MNKHSLSFRYLWLGQSMSNIGDILIIVGLMPLLYQSTQSAFLMALVPVVKTLSSVVSASFAPFIFNLFNLKNSLALSQILKSIVSLMIIILFYFQYYESYNWIIYFLIGLLGLFDGWSKPASKALIPRIVKRNLILKSNSWMESINQTIEVVIWSVGALLVASFNEIFPFILTFLLYILSYLLITKIYLSKYEVTNQSKEKNEILIGWKEINKKKDLKLLITIGLLLTIANIIWLASFMYIYVEEALETDVEWWGYINSFLTAGILIASVVAYKKADFLRNNFILIFKLTLLSMAISTMFLAGNSIALLALICALIYGLSSQLQGLLEVTYFQLNIDEKKLPYVYASQDVLNLLTFSVFTILLSILVDTWSIRILFFSMGIVIFLSLILFIIFLNTLNKRSNNN